MTLADLATEGSFVLSAGAGIGLGAMFLVKYWIDQKLDEKLSPIRVQTAQLDHNGGGHVADYARDARDESIKTNAKLDELAISFQAHLVEDAYWKGQADAKLNK